MTTKRLNRVLDERRRRRSSRSAAKQVALMIAPLVLLMQPASAIFNCLAPNMFKMGKVGQPNIYGADRAGWYPQQQQQHYIQQGYPQVNHAQNPFKLLFQPKWKSGGLFGNRGWNSLRSNANFYRPGYGYSGGYSNTIPAPSGGYPLNEQLNVAPFTVPAGVSSYSHSNDGWSAPLINSYNQQKPIQQNQLNSYDSYSQAPLTVVEPPPPPPSKPIVQPSADPYSTKGGSSSSKNKVSTTTKNANILLAAGGYNSFDAHLLPANFRNRTFGYSYPEWYSGVADSPAKIAQQLMKFGGFKRQRLQEQQLQQQQEQLNFNQTTAFLAARLTEAGNKAKFTILDEPRFVGFGTVELDSNREARLSCSFGEAIDQNNRSLWVKFLGPYNSSQMDGGTNKVVPPFNCANSQCRTLEVESIKDYRYRFDNGPATSTLIISEPRLEDYGIYRCSALTKAINGNPLETIYQIVRFGTI